MNTIMTAKELARRCEEIARNHKTLYVLGCFGAPLNAKNRRRYSQNYSYNAKTERMKKIQAADDHTFGFDCVCLIKGVLWGWNGDHTKTYGGAKYASNGVPDSGADAMFRKCTGQSNNFSSLEIGEALWRSGHIGIYIGNGLAVECTPNWADGVQITAVNGAIAGYPTRKWASHGKLPYVDYERYPLSRFRMETSLVAEQLPNLSEQKNRVHILVCLVQKRLNSLGFAAGSEDGVFGPVTRAAVQEFQKAQGGAVTGMVDDGTWDLLLEVENNG